MSLTKFSLKRPVTTLLVVLALAVFGISSLLGLRLELMPDMDMPVMMVMTIYPGADPESVEEPSSRSAAFTTTVRFTSDDFAPSVRRTETV